MGTPMSAADAPATDAERVATILERLTLEQKTAQIVGFWEKGDGEVVAPLQGEFTRDGGLDDAMRHGLGHLTRVYGTRPVDPVERARWLWQRQRELVATVGIPALVHEECLTGLSAWQAATFPTPLAWGASFHPELVGRMAELIGQSMSALGVHQGLAPVLDVIRDPRWGRVEECISEDPYLIGTIGTAYVRGLQSAGVHATLKHFVGYSASQSGRNFGPVHAGPREIADVLLVPFEMAVRDGGVRSVMHAYTEIDGVPTAADPTYLTHVLRGQWGFDGVVVADYFGVAFLDILHHVAEGLGEAAGLALAAGVDIELPTGTRSSSRSSRRSATAWWTRRSSTGRSRVRCCRRPSWVCSTRRSTSRRPRSSSTLPRTVPSRRSSRRSRWCCSRTTGSSRCWAGRAPLRAAWRCSARTPTSTRRCSAATRS